MTNKICNLLDNFQALENEQGMLGTAIGILILVIGFLTSLAIGIGFIYIAISFGIELINKIFF